MTTQSLSKAEKKIRKAVYQVHIGVNTLSNNGCYDIARARRRANSYRYWLNVAGRFALVNGRLI